MPRLKATPQRDSHEEDAPEDEDRWTLEEEIPPGVRDREATANDDQQAERGLPERATELELHPPSPCGQNEERAEEAEFDRKLEDIVMGVLPIYRLAAFRADLGIAVLVRGEEEPESARARSAAIGDSGKCER